jgi:hypothetical protein
MSCACTEAEKSSQVAKIAWDQKIMEKESAKKISEIEGNVAVLYLICTGSLMFVGVYVEKTDVIDRRSDAACSRESQV